jgi:UDP-N-acetylmuramyl pentapeptide phosphotransferase/UDP-N-acetylglucosamine-1-phosphate transferase
VAPILYFGGVAGFAAFLLALAVARDWRRVGVLIGLGICLALGWILFAYFSARRGLDRKADGFEPADELANVLSHATVSTKVDDRSCHGKRLRREIRTRR